MYIYIYITELIEETGKPPEQIFACRDIFGLARKSSSLGKKIIYLTEL